MKNPLRIVFMGTPEFAVESLDKLCGSMHTVVAAITAPDKPAGRGTKLRTSAVKDYCEEKDITLWQPLNLKDESFLQRVRYAEPDLIVVVAFRMLPEVLWKIPSFGTINLHASLLPDYRGAAPINWAIINGETETGVTTFFINESIDTGDIIDQEKVKIEPDMDAGELHDQLKILGANLLLKTIDRIAEDEDEVSLRSQASVAVKKTLNPAPKITKENSRIDWSLPATKILNLIRGLCPYPGAYTLNQHDDSVVKIFRASVSDGKLPPGKLRFTGKQKMEIGTGTDAIEIKELQTAGKKRLAVNDFMNGFRSEHFDSFL